MSAEPQKKQFSDTTSVDGLEDVFVEVDDLEEIEPGSSADEGIKLSEASDKYGVTVRTIQRWIKEGRLLAHKIDGQYGPEWRVTGEKSSHDKGINQGSTQGGQHVDIDLTPTVEQLNDTVGSLTNLVENFSHQLKDASEGLQAANYRIGYLENQDQVLREQIKLLPDLESQANKASELEKEKIEKEEEVTELKDKITELDRELKEAKEKEELLVRIQAELEELKTKQLEEEAKKNSGFWKWFVGNK